jgi:predicted nuclease of predicted toxin-antitoxin system
VKLLLDENLSDRIPRRIIDLYPESECVSLVYVHTLKFVHLRIRNIPTSKFVQILRNNFDTIVQFENSELESILVLV